MTLGPTGGGAVVAGGLGAKAVVAIFAEGQQGPGSAVVYRRGSSTTTAIPCDTGDHAINFESTATGRNGDVCDACGQGEGIVRTFAENDVAIGNAALPVGPAHVLETPDTYAQTRAGPHYRIEAEAKYKEIQRLSAVGAFEEEGGT